MSIPTRSFGKTGIPVTVLGFGAMELRGRPRGPEIADEDAGKLLNSVLDAGINFVDTSIDYGRSEELIGRYISSRRDEYFLASKCGCLIDPPAGGEPPFPHDFSAHNVRNGVEQSLRRLNTDHLDLVQVHMSPARAELEDSGTVEELQQLQSEGKIRFLGMSGTLPHIVDHLEMGVFDAYQIPYSALQREHEEIISSAASRGAGTVIRGGAARGAPAEEKDWTRSPIGMRDGDAERRWLDADLDDLLEGLSRVAFTLRFTLTHPDMHTTIVGTSKIDHLLDNVKVAELGPLPSDVYAEAKRRLSEAGASPA